MNSDRSSREFCAVDNGEKFELLNEESRKVDTRKPAWRRLAPWLLHGFFLTLYLAILPFVASRWTWQQQKCVDKVNSYC